MPLSFMLSHEETTAFQAERHELISPDVFFSEEEYVLHLIHKFAYQRAAALAGDGNVLDLGCNTGYGAAILSESGAEVTGADVSAKAISKAGSLYGNRGIRFALVNGKELPFEKGEFDFIAGFQVIEHIADYESFLGEVKRVLSPKGLAMFSTPNAALRLNPGMKPWNPFHVREFNARELESLLKPFFRKIDVAGLSAREPLYSAEATRVRRIRDKTARRERIKKLIPTPLLNGVKKLAKSFPRLSEQTENTPGPASNFGNAGAIEDLFYAGDTENALDLAAFCSDDDGVLSQALVKLNIS